MKFKIFVLTCLSVFIIQNSVKGQTPKLDPYNIVWTEQSKNASESMPLVGGDIGCNVWVEDGDILMYVQRSGSLSENGEYLKMGRIRIQLYPNPLTSNTSFKQELKLKDGFVEIVSIGENGDKKLNTRLKLWVEVNRPIVHVDVDANSEIEVVASYESWRTEKREIKDSPGRRERFTIFNLEGYRGEVFRVKDEIEFTDKGILFYHRNPEEKLVPDILIKQQGLGASADKIYDDIKNRTFGGLLLGEGFVNAGNGKGKYEITPFKSWKIKSKTPRKKHQIAIVTHIDQTETIEKWKNQLFKSANSSLENSQKLFEKTITWWHQFWDRSHIMIFPENADPSNPIWQMSRNYQLFRYQLGGNVYGEYPTKFNGGNLIFDPVLVAEKFKYEPDWRQWGGAVHTAQNQRLLYWPMLKAGDFDAILPQFELYRKGLPAAEARVKKHFGHDGAVFSEYMSASGVALGSGWGWEGNGHRGRGKEIPFGDPLATGARGYNSFAEAGVMANQSVAYHWESQVEHAYMILEYHRFSGRDITQYMPFIKAALLFFDEHYQLRQKMRNGKALDEEGKLVIYPSTSCESYRGANNPTDIIAGLKACLQSMLVLDEKYVSVDEKKYCAEYLQRVPDFAFDEVDGLRIIKPAKKWLKEDNLELPQFYPLFPFDQFKLGDEELQTFKNTYKLAPPYRKGTIISWHQDGIFFARMGMTNEAADYNTKKLQDSPRRFPTFWGPGHDWVPDHNWGGSGMIGLQEMLMQTNGKQILLFPAWPKEWNVDFKLNAPYETTVEATLKNGELIKLKVTPEFRKKDVVIHFK
ncbi:DUF5703 domain-containing protein [Flavivirga rizhaonensis]|uniref:DUF5703 domain-containing protein n=1 Tax=Flavivirga rizhaonensis TaxID=2559571 RepID=A0A4S1E1Y4_9FLAO|nr:DUF5703 domain-containing protein [Flavivirga rizhaonensis]TGV04617.1 hypothetical protein EM932_00380 [Flavivirga rizhaonensis]